MTQNVSMRNYSPRHKTETDYFLISVNSRRLLKEIVPFILASTINYLQGQPLPMPITGWAEQHSRTAKSANPDLSLYDETISHDILPLIVAIETKGQYGVGKILRK